MAVSAADCRLMAFNTPDDATRFWIKVHNLSFMALNRILALLRSRLSIEYSQYSMSASESCSCQFC